VTTVVVLAEEGAVVEEVEEMEGEEEEDILLLDLSLGPGHLYPPDLDLVPVQGLIITIVPRDHLLGEDLDTRTIKKTLAFDLLLSLLLAEKEHHHVLQPR